MRAFFVFSALRYEIGSYSIQKKENHDKHVVLFLSGNFVYFEITIIIYTLKQLFYYFICALM